MDAAFLAGSDLSPGAVADCRLRGRRRAVGAAIAGCKFVTLWLSSSRLLVDAARESPDQPKPAPISTFPSSRLAVASLGDTVVVRWTQCVRIDAAWFAATMQALSRAGAPVIFCLRGDSFSLAPAGTKGN